MDLSLRGHRVLERDPFLEDLLIERLQEERLSRYLELVTIVEAIRDAAGVIVSGEGKFKGSSESLKKLRDLLFPEYEDNLEEKAKNTAALLEKEFERGPLTVQALDYGSRKKKKPQ